MTDISKQIKEILELGEIREKLSTDFPSNKPPSAQLLSDYGGAREAINDRSTISIDIIRKQQEAIKEAYEVLDRLARLGNGELIGNSRGNGIAKRALTKLKPFITEDGQ